MKLCCPDCAQMLGSDDINIQNDLALCPACQKEIRISSLLSTTPANENNGPSPEVVFIKDHADNSVDVLIHESGLRGLAKSLFVFSIIWTSFTLFMSSLFVLGGSGKSCESSLAIPILMLGLFLVIGIGMLYSSCWLAWGTTALHLDASGIRLLRQLGKRIKVKSFPLSQAIFFSQEVAYTDNYQPVFACCLHANNKKHNFGHHLSGVDQEWLVEQLNFRVTRLKSTSIST